MRTWTSNILLDIMGVFVDTLIPQDARWQVMESHCIVGDYWVYGSTS